MDIADLITPRSVVAQLRAANKKQALQELAKRAAAMTGIHERAIYDVLIERERLGSTGIGTGVGIPHGKLPGLTRLYGIFARLERPIPFEAIDDQPVDLIFLLLAPEGAGADHLKALALVSRLLRDRTVCEKLRGTDKADALYALLTDAATHPPSPPDDVLPLSERSTARDRAGEPSPGRSSRSGSTVICVPSAACTAKAADAVDEHRLYIGEILHPEECEFARRHVPDAFEFLHFVILPRTAAAPARLTSPNRSARAWPRSSRSLSRRCAPGSRPRDAPGRYAAGHCRAMRR